MLRTIANPSGAAVPQQVAPRQWGLLVKSGGAMAEQGAQEVAESALSLLRALEAGDLEMPPLCTWPGWQHWRATEGRRPKMPADRALWSAFQLKESRLRKIAMEWAYLTQRPVTS